VRRHSQEPTSLNVVAVTPDGERTMLAYRGASPRYAPADLPHETVTTCDLLHVSGYVFLDTPQSDAALLAIDVARRGEIPVSLDLPVGPAEKCPEMVISALPLTDLLVVGVPEAASLVGAGSPEALASRLLALGVGTVALKLGAQGALIADAEGTVTEPACRVTAVDTTGAGDAFAAGAIAARLSEATLPELGRLANLCGAAAIGKRGAGSNMPSLSELGSI
jgi:ribokinase